MGYIAWFEELSRKDVPRVGTKGTTLGEMVRSGVPVPPGFVVTMEAFDAFQRRNNLTDEMDARLSDLAVDDGSALNAVAEILKDRARKAEIPRDVRDAIIDAYQELGRRSGKQLATVSVCSSSERIPQDSSAGMFRKFLNISGPDALIARIQDCWVSAFGERAVYRVERGASDAEQVTVAVAMVMVSSDCPGGMLAVSPMDGSLEDLVVEAGSGLGELLVTGRVQPKPDGVRRREPEIIGREIARGA